MKELKELIFVTLCKDARKKCKEKENQHGMKEIWLFLDEFNTSPDIGWFNELICNHTLDGVAIPKEIKIIAACNPYRKREHNLKNNPWYHKDPLAKYVYRVFPLCQTVKAHLWQFGSLSELDERQYILEMIKDRKKELSSNTQTIFDSEAQLIAEKIFQSQQFMRTRLQDMAMVSLRDVERCLKIFIWLVKDYNSYDMQQSLVIALGICYYLRLEKNERKKYASEITEANNFVDILKKEIQKFCNVLYSLAAKTIAKTEALNEILFMLFICIMTTTSIVLVGDPGTSKTLAFQLLKDRLSKSNINELQKDLQEQGIRLQIKALHVISFQCTQDSKPVGIKERWDQAISHSKSEDIMPMLLLDEIGLAEHSKHSPLKVLHHILENPKIPFVALSNWPLDAAKMNRAIVHQIPNNLKSDIEDVAKAILKENSNEISKFSENEIALLVNVFSQLNDELSKQSPTASFKETWLGRRDFYGLIRYHLHHPLPTQTLEGIMRNLGDCDNPNFQKHLIAILKAQLKKSKAEILELMNLWRPLKCIERNIQDNDCRHCLVICQKPYSWQLLLDHKLLSHEDTVFLFESKFATDVATITKYDHLHKVINCMEAGKKVVLYNLKSIYESLYDMLNQSIILMEEVAMENLTRDCVVEKWFKCIVIVTEQDIEKMQKAFFGRFERQWISHIGSLPSADVQKVEAFKDHLIKTYNLSNENELCELFCGFNSDTIPSAITHMRLRKQNDDQDKDLKQDGTTQFLQLFLPLRHPAKIVDLVMTSRLPNVGNVDQSFRTFKKNLRKEMLLILTCDLECNVFQQKWRSKRVSEYMEANHLEKDVKNFFESADKSPFILQYQHKSEDLTQFFQIKCIIEAAYALYCANIDEEKTEYDKLLVLIVHNTLGQKDPFPIFFSQF
ncbi:hypothetical protein RFI_12444 [Reticulomyxa filosa]|uniref:AAA+ ATPase domain-containing protein n=1 Tax=Reticulomyxa filosa TaxID=46433 RepID=X6NH81_RETFI|nr:hypothetical protein RFI_12444 [Reticulomyxa filosa]|eukprot:ETO24712.1 hypothetical protein RFI_12444 [Reticulomyxa filosa]